MTAYRTTTHAEYVDTARSQALDAAVVCPACDMFVHPDNLQKHLDTYHDGRVITLPLTESARQRLAKHENVIHETFEQYTRAAFKFFCEIGEALLAIRDEKLYRETHSTFEDYCWQRWKLKQSRAYQLIDAAEVIASLKSSTIVELPKNEAQARPLAALPAKLRPMAWGFAAASPIRNASYVASSAEVVRTAELTGAVDDGEGGQIPASEATPADYQRAIDNDYREKKLREQGHKHEDRLKLDGVIVDCQGDTPMLTIRIEGDVTDLIGRSVTLYVSELAK